MFAIILQFSSLKVGTGGTGGCLGPLPPPWAGKDGGYWATWDSAAKDAFCAEHTDQAGKGHHDDYCDGATHVVGA